MGATEIRQRLTDYHAFMTLASALVEDHKPECEEFNNFLKETQSFLSTATSKELKDCGKTLEDLLVTCIKSHGKLFPAKKSVRVIANDFNRLRESEDVWRYGISYGWLQERFDCSMHRQFKDLPCHARIGIGIHARKVSNEESTLLSDAFFLLVQARERYAKLMDVAESLKSRSIKISLESYDATSALTSAACTFSRLGVLTAAAFVETFVNSVGWNESVSRGFPEGDLDTLKGLEKGRFLSLEKKLELIPPIIRGDKIRTIIISDDKQIKEPFKSFLQTTKEVRNASMHYAPGKAAIIRAPQQWLVLVEDAVKQSVSVAREFWSACYPGKDQPMYLASLYYEGLLKEATDRLINAGSSMAISG